MHDKKFYELQKIYQGMQEDIRGEYWVDLSGNVEGADIDINDIGHEGVVLQKLMSEYTDMFDIDYERSPRENLGSYEEEIKKFLIDLEIINNEELSSKYDEDPSGFTWDNFIVKTEKAKKHNDQVKDALGLIWDIPGNMKDARDYAMKYFGDKRVAGNNIQTWTITSQDLRAIGNGLWEINGDDIDDAEEFNIEVMNPQNRMMFWNVPWEVLQLDDPSKLMIYSER
jgi:hypothetical protein